MIDEFTWAKNLKTPDSTIDNAIKAFEEDDCSLISHIAEEILSDRQDDTGKFLTMYKNASDKQKMIIDVVLVYITGWSLKSLLEQMGINIGKDYEAVPCNETVSLWIESFKEQNKDLDEEIEEIKGAIENERIWQKGASSEGDANMFTQAIADYKAYLTWLKDQKKPSDKADEKEI